MKVALVLNGSPPTPHELALLDGCDAVVCADGGARAVLASGRRPSLIVGDMDSLPQAVRLAAERAGMPLDVHPAHKDATDGELALARALAMRPDALLILGGHGGASAMFLASLHLLRRASDACDARMVGAGESLRFVLAGRIATLDRRDGALLSVMPWEGDLALSLEGTAWDARELVIPAGSARGVSNRIVGEQGAVRVHRGVAFVVQAQ
ncbi:MAG: thiamine diphosphokinase [Halobacteriales archaeon]|nr:thiamine diphosphokinase [Halobacteriales archaeon]